VSVYVNGKEEGLRNDITEPAKFFTPENLRRMGRR
jgi:hypothetical protein